MANSLTAANKEAWARMMQEEREKTLAASSLADLQLVELLDSGDKVHKVYSTRMLARAFTRGTDITPLDQTITDESFDVDQFMEASVYLDKIDLIQASYNLTKKYTDEAMYALNRKVDAALFSEYDNAASAVDNQDFGGTTANERITATESNITKIFSIAARKLDNKNVSRDNRFLVVSPTGLQTLVDYASSRDTSFGDEVARNGRVGMWFGFEVYVSTNLTFTARWTPANQPSDADTVTINGVTLTFETGTIDTAGEVKSETSTAVTLDNLVTALNAPGTSVSAVYSAVSVANQILLEGIVATDGTTYADIEHVGGGEIAVSASETNDPWSLEQIHWIAGQKGATNLALQLYPDLTFNQEPKRTAGSGNLIASEMYGFKTFERDKDKLVRIRVDGSSF